MKNLQEKAKKIKDIYEDIWMGLDNVSGVSTGQTSDGKICLVISLRRDDPATKDIFPREIEGFPVEFRITGDINAN